VCLYASCSLNLHRLLAKSILNAFRFIALAPFSAHTCQYSTHTFITVVSTKVIDNSNLPFFGSNLSEKSPRISVEQFNILDLSVVKRHKLVMIFLLDPISPCSPENIEMRMMLLLSLYISAETFTECKYFA